jgi:hypothetical protein
MESANAVPTNESLPDVPLMVAIFSIPESCLKVPAAEQNSKFSKTRTY